MLRCDPQSHLDAGGICRQLQLAEAAGEAGAEAKHGRAMTQAAAQARWAGQSMYILFHFQFCS